MPRFYYSINLWIFVLNSPSLPSPCLQQNTKNYESNANIEWEVQFPCLAEEKEGWYFCKMTFKRVIPSMQTGKFRYTDTEFVAFVKAKSGMESYQRIINHLKSRQEIDARSQFPSAKGHNFTFDFQGQELPVQVQWTSRRRLFHKTNRAGNLPFQVSVSVLKRRCVKKNKSFLAGITKCCNFAQQKGSVAQLD